MNLRRLLLCSFVVIVTGTFIYSLSFSLREHRVEFDVLLLLDLKLDMAFLKWH